MELIRGLIQVLIKILYPNSKVEPVKSEISEKQRELFFQQLKEHGATDEDIERLKNA